MTVIDEWRTCDNPARLIEMLGDKADEKRLLEWGEWCEAEYRREGGRQHDLARWWLNNTRAAFGWKKSANVLRCLWPNPAIERERVECPECEGEGTMEYLIAEDDTAEFPCETCRGQKEIESPIIDPGWLTDNVVGIARTIRGECPCELKHEHVTRPELMPILGDALMDAGCDNDDVIEHCQCGFHVGGCWVVDGILGTV